MGTCRHYKNRIKNNDRCLKMVNVFENIYSNINFKSNIKNGKMERY
jgi:uncharacterized cysteine cluster protein YcgN (CxxCxxCC family)